jgi:CheY-like chemotaxis protein
VANILCIGASDATMETRRMLLESAGHTVTEAKDLREVTAACQTGSVDIAILGQDLPEKEKVRVSDTIRRMSGARILELHIGVAPELPSADAHLQTIASAPEGLLECVNELLSHQRARGA